MHHTRPMRNSGRTLSRPGGPLRRGHRGTRAPSLAARQRGARRAGRAPRPPAGIGMPGLKTAREKTSGKNRRWGPPPASEADGGASRWAVQSKQTLGTPGAPGARPQRRQPQTRPEGSPVATGAVVHVAYKAGRVRGTTQYAIQHRLSGPRSRPSASPPGSGGGIAEAAPDTAAGGPLARGFGAPRIRSGAARRPQLNTLLRIAPRQACTQWPRGCRQS